jgi:ATP-binding cassette subfamily B protein
MSKKTTHSFKDVTSIYWSYVSKYKLRVFLLLLTVTVGSFLLRYAPALVVAGVLNKLTQGNFSADTLWATFGSDIALYVLVIVIGSVILWRLAIIILWSLEIKVTQNMSRDIFNKLMTLDSSFHANRFSGSLVSQANKFTGAYVRMFDTTIFDVLGLILAFVFTSILLWAQAPIVVIFLIVFSILFLLISIRITRHVRVLNEVEASVSNKQTGFLADMVTNIMAVKSYAAEKHEARRYAVATDATAEAGRNLMIASAKTDIFFSSSTALLSIGAFIIAILSVVLWNANAATVFLIISYTGQITHELWNFGRGTLRNYNRALGDAQEMTEILKMTPTIENPKQPNTLTIKNGELTFKDIMFTHDGSDTPLFKNFNLTIPAGQKIGLVGHSGSGKTTLTKLLLRFNDIDSGTISIDNISISSVTQDDLHSAIAYVPQEPMLFHRSLKENIMYGKPDASDEKVQRAAQQANALEFINKLPTGFETLVGERGVKLSGGQRQRIAIARAVIKDAPILILDEATSALDSESEKLIQDALQKLMKNRTSIVIAHRLSTIAKLDRIIVMEEGAIIEDGSHAELLAKKGRYAQLWAHQSGGFIEE